MWNDPVRECNRLLGKVCRISERVSSSPGKQLDTHGQEGQAGPLCCSARGMHWREAGPCSGRNAVAAEKAYSFVRSVSG